MKYNASNKPIVCMQTQSTCYNGTTIGRPVGILWHDTNGGNPYISRYVQPSDNDPNKGALLALLGKNQYGNDWNHIKHGAGLNYWVGKLADGTIASVQSMPDNYRPWGCGSGNYGSCNGSPNVTNSPFWIQFEICDDGYKSADYFAKAYREACELTAYLCKLYNIDPNGTVKYNGVTVPTILCHADSHKLGLGSNHGDIYLWFKNYGKDMTTVRKDVSALLSGDPVVQPEPVQTSNKIEAGDVVSITPGGTYYSGKTIPSWVVAKRWIVESVSGDRAVIDKSEDGKNSIRSAVNTKYLTVSNEEENEMTLDTFKELMKQYRAELQDNDAGNWSEEARKWAIETGMLVGSGKDANGNPNYMYGDFLTREQAAMLFYRFAQKCGLV